MNKYYITTAIDYTNDVIHIGHAYQKILADVLARYHRQLGDKTFFLTGTDEHGTTSEQAAKKAGKEPKEFVDEISAKDKEQIDSLNISYDRFIRTTDPDHKELVREFYLKVKSNGDIYKGTYKGLYCVGCESYKTEGEIVDGKCPLHPTRELQSIEEENYFFTWSKYENFLRNHIEENPNFIKPEARKNEMLAFLDQGLRDIAISRQRDKVSWGIPIPNDPKHVFYVWFDALLNYISGAPDFWPASVHILGKDNVRWHALLWPAMLKSAGYPLPKTIYGHGFATIDGQKISKSLGNIIRPTELVKEFGVDGTRHYFLRYGPLTEDTDIKLSTIKDTYNSDLANNLGNLVSRVAKIAESSNFEFPPAKVNIQNPQFAPYHKTLEEFRLNDSVSFVWEKISEANKFIDENRPWEQEGESLKQTLEHLVVKINEIASLLKPFLPKTAEKIEKQFKGPKISFTEPLFPRI
ncbi:MAG: methionine--tRNA ligase [Candidatus Blackburnbacteria bacterium]|nr:methionine--tRNA ligase [Candidatus Blackburnbacteria bacterium]